MLRILEIAIIIFIVIYGITKLVVFLSPKASAKRREVGLEKLREKAKKAALDKKNIQEETQKNKDIINEIDNTLNN